LNEHLPEGQKLTDLEHILHVLDFDGSGNIELNEFFEVCRRFYTFP
jgi:Ca2+-binding EF-hand superfamily protein